MKAGADKELEAMQDAYKALSGLDEEEKARVLRWLADKTGVPPSQRQPTEQRTPAELPAKPEGSGVSLTPKQFLAQKKPINQVQQVTCLAYYLTHDRTTTKFKGKHISELNTEAAGTRLSNVSYAMRDAVTLGYLASAGSAAKQITALGEEVVKALPDQETVKGVLKDLPRRKRKPPSKARKSKSKMKNK